MLFAMDWWWYSALYGDYFLTNNAVSQPQVTHNDLSHRKASVRRTDHFLANARLPVTPLFSYTSSPPYKSHRAESAGCRMAMPENIQYV